MRRRSAVEITPRADRDLDDVYDHILEGNADAASRFYRAARHAFDLLAAAPRAGAKRTSRLKSLRALRMWPIPEFEIYLIYYTPTRYGVRVVRVLHGARDAARLLKLL